MNTEWRRAPEVEALLLSRADVIRERLSTWEPPTESEIRTITGDRVKPRASEIHYCLRRQALTLMLPAGATRTLTYETTLRFAYGRAVHGAIQASFPEARHEGKVAHEDLTGTWDTLWPDRVDDYKTSTKPPKRKPKPEHVAQVSFYGVQEGREQVGVIYLAKNGEGRISFEPGSVVAFVGPPDREAVDKMLSRARVVREHLGRGSLPDYPGEMWECRECPVLRACHQRLPDAELRLRNTKVVGMTFRETSVAAAIEGLKQGSELSLEWDGANPYGSRLPGDPHHGAAVRVLLDGLHIGFLPDAGSGSPTAQHVAIHIRDGGTAKAFVSELTGKTPEKPNRGINLSLFLSAPGAL